MYTTTAPPMPVIRTVIALALLCALPFARGHAADAWQSPSIPPLDSGQPRTIHVIKLDGELSEEGRERFDTALRAAEDEDAVALVRLNSFGGDLDVAEAYVRKLAGHGGETVAYIDELAAGSSAAIPFAADAIYFAPSSVIGSTTPGDSRVEALTPSMKEEVEAFLDFALDAVPGSDHRRGELLKTMFLPSHVLEVEGQILSGEGQLLALAADAASRTYGGDDQGERPLLGAGVVDSLSELLDSRFGEGNWRLAEQGTPARTTASGEWRPPQVGLPGDGEERQVYVIRIEGEISSPNLYVLKRALKEAIREDVDTVVVEFETPGGRSDLMMEYMDALKKFEGEVLAFVNDNALSAGAIIAIAADDIYLTPEGKIGAAAAISATGSDVPETLLAKLESVLLAEIRYLTRDDPRKGEVLKAMIQPEYVLEIDGEVLTEEGELLTLVGEEAMEIYGGDELGPRPLLGAGIGEDVSEVLNQRYGPGNWEIKTFEKTWSEEFAHIINPYIPIVLGIGMLMLFIEIKTPGFGIFGIAGIVLIVLSFAANYVIGLAGNEALAIFILGVVLLGVEMFVFPGTFIFGGIGLLMIIGSLLWSLADIWPGHWDEIDAETFVDPFYRLLIAMSVAVIGSIAFWRFLPSTPIHRRMVLSPEPRTAAGGIENQHVPGSAKPAIGTLGVATTDIHPGGEVEIGGKRYQATVDLGTIRKGDEIEVVAHKTFSLVVRRAS